MKARSLHSCLVAIATAAAAVPPAPAPGVVNLNGTYFRENSLALCEWGSSDRSFMNFILGSSGVGPWTCRAQTKPWDDSCTFSDAPDLRPTDAVYWLHVRDQANNYVGDLQWPDASALYEVWYQQCRRVPGGDDYVQASSVTGQPVAGSTCSFSNSARQVVLTEVDSGVVEHIKPAQVRGRVRIGGGSMRPRGANDVILAVQVYGRGGWVDHATVVATTASTPTTHEISTTVPPGADVRMQVRGRIRCDEHPGVGYDVREGRIQVETCIPDQSDPSHCL